MTNETQNKSPDALSAWKRIEKFFNPRFTYPYVSDVAAIEAALNQPAQPEPKEPIADLDITIKAGRECWEQTGKSGFSIISQLVLFDLLEAARNHRDQQITQGEPVLWQFRFEGEDWQELKPKYAGMTQEQAVQEMKDFIAAGYKYEMRLLYANSQITQGDREAALEAVENLRLTHGTEENPYVCFHPTSEYSDYNPSRIWQGNKEGFIDSRVTFRAIDAFNDVLPIIRRALQNNSGV